MPSRLGGFAVRHNAELAVERPVQQHGVHRDGMMITPLSSENAAATEVAGLDAKRGDPLTVREDEAALNGRMLLALAIGYESLDALRKAFEECGAEPIAVGEVA